jgi:hypothetical protein
VKALLNLAGSALGLAGALLCLAAGVMRVVGAYHLGDFEVMTLFNAGIGLMVAACLAKLQSLPHR